MTTSYPFTPTTLAPFAFQPLLDGQLYNATVPWNLWGQRWYLSLSSTAGQQIVYTAVVGSLDPVQLPLTTQAGLYTASVVLPSPPTIIGANWSINSSNVPTGTTVAAVTPSGVLRLSEPATVTGTDQSATFSFSFNLVAGFGFTSTLIFLASSQTFQTDP